MEEIHQFSESTVQLQLLLQEATRTLQQLFRKIYKDKTSNDWIDSEDSVTSFLSSILDEIEKTNQDSIKRIRRGNVESWDITLLHLILPKICPDEKMKHPLNSIEEVWDTCTNNPFLAIEEFDKLSSKIETAIVALGGDAQKCQEILSSKEIMENDDAKKLAEKDDSVRNPKNDDQPPAILKAQKSCRATTLKIWQYKSEIEKKALEGKKYAQILVEAMTNFEIGSKLLSSSSSSMKLSEKSKILHHFALCFKSATDVVNLTPEMLPILFKLCKESVTDGFETAKSALDLDARIIICKLMQANDFEDMYELLFQCLLKYPKEPYFHWEHCHLFAAHGDSLRASELALESLQYFPNDIELLHLRIDYDYKSRTGPSQADAKTQVDTTLRFLKLAPPDHPYVPEAYYTMAVTSDAASARVNKNYRGPPLVSLNYYKMGQDAEKMLLPCFLPYKHTVTKLAFESSHITVCNNGRPLAKETAEGTLQTDPPPIIDPWMEKLSGSHRVKIVLAHREEIKSILGKLDENSKIPDSKLETSSRNKKKNKLASLKETTIEEMNSGEFNHQKNNCVIKLTLMEDIYLGSRNNDKESIGSVVCDERGDFQKINFFSIQLTPEIKKGLCFGSTISIIHPTYTGPGVTESGQHLEGLQVHDSNLIIFHEDDEPKCRFCGSPNPSMSCSRCKRAKYCNSTCQKTDWELLKHKLICKVKFTKFLDLV